MSDKKSDKPTEKLEPKTSKDLESEKKDPQEKERDQQAQEAQVRPHATTRPLDSKAPSQDPEIAKIQGRVDTVIPAQIPDVYRVPMEQARDALNGYNSDDPSSLTAVTRAYEGMKAAAIRWSREQDSDLSQKVSLYGTHWLERLQRTLEPRPLTGAPSTPVTSKRSAQ